MKVCDVSGCMDVARSRGWCNAHYARWQRHGDPLAFNQRPRWPKNLLRRLRFMPDGCIEFTGPTTLGYGRVSRGGQSTGAHRAAYELVRGPIPPGLDLDHLCRNRRCVHPGHLEPVTRQENLLRGHAARRAS